MPVANALEVVSLGIALWTRPLCCRTSWGFRTSTQDDGPRQRLGVRSAQILLQGLPQKVDGILPPVQMGPLFMEGCQTRGFPEVFHTVAHAMAY